MRSRDVGIRFSPNSSKGFECFCNAAFAGNWNKAGAEHDLSTAKSQSGWIIFFAGCPIIWESKLQSQVALSTTEAEYKALSMFLQDVLPIMCLLDEMKDRNFQVMCTTPHVYCNIFEDSSGARELARLQNFVHAPNTSMCVTITSESTCTQGRSRSSPLEPRIRLLTP